MQRRTWLAMGIVLTAFTGLIGLAGLAAAAGVAGPVAAEAEAGAGAGAGAGTGTGTDPACPSMRFADFIERFAEDEAVQRRYTAVPLRQVRFVPDILGRPYPMRSELGRERIEFPVMPSRAAREAAGAEQETQEGAGEAVVWIRTPARGRQTAYFFGKAACWWLERIEDGRMKTD